MSDPPGHILARYPFLVPNSIHALKPADSFSGAALWKIESSATFCLKAWPITDIAPERLGWIHRLMQHARRAGLSFVPDVMAARDGSTWLSEAGCLWDLTTWMPGQPDSHSWPTAARVAAACTALARIHVTWSGIDASQGPCPALQRRLDLHGRWFRLVRGGWRPAFCEDDPASPSASQAWDLLATHIDQVPKLLAGWQERPLALQPCICDIWRAHVLFEGDAVSGIIDYGSAKVDNSACDLARLLGSLAGDDAELRNLGLRAYRTVRPLSLEEEALVDVLDRTGTILSAANWLMMLYGRQEGGSGRAELGRERRAEAGRRLAEVVQRMQGWAS